jgi:tight adherence protein C
MLWIIWIVVFAACFLLTYGLSTEWQWRHRVKVRAGNPGVILPLPLHVPRHSWLWQGLLEWLAFSGQWAMPDMGKISEMRKDLIRAGFRHPKAPAIYLGLRLATAFILTMPYILFLVIRGAINPLTLLFGFALAIFGFFLPINILVMLIHGRQERLDRALPDILDMFVICMEAGLSLNTTINRVADEVGEVFTDFADELQIASAEIRASIPWDEAFDNIAKRTDVQSIRSMVALMVQSHKLGSSISDALRRHSEFIRTQRLLRAEEKAAKLPVKMIFPLIFCIFPAIIIVVAGPGIIHMAGTFLNGGMVGMFQYGNGSPGFPGGFQ